MWHLGTWLRGWPWLCWVNSMILKVFSNLNDSIILFKSSFCVARASKRLARMCTSLSLPLHSPKKSGCGSLLGHCGFFLLFFYPYKLSSPGNTQKGDHEVPLRFCAFTDSSCQRENLWRQFVLDVSKAIAQLTFILIKTKKKINMAFCDTLIPC